MWQACFWIVDLNLVLWYAWHDQHNHAFNSHNHALAIMLVGKSGTKVYSLISGQAYACVFEQELKMLYQLKRQNSKSDLPLLKAIQLVYGKYQGGIFKDSIASILHDLPEELLAL